MGGCSDTPAELSAGGPDRGSASSDASAPSATSAGPARQIDPAATTLTAAVGVGGKAGGSEGGSGEAEPGSPGGTDATSPAPSGGQTSPGEAFPPLTTVPGDRRHAQQWDSYTVSTDDRTLTFRYYAGVEPCSVFDSIVADQGATSVRVTVYERSGPDGVACIMLAQEKTASVTLDAPLAGRAVV